MACLDAPGFRMRRDIDFGLLRMAWRTKDLQVLVIIRPSQGKRNDMINVPSFSGSDLQGAFGAASVRLQKQCNPLFGRKARSVAHDALGLGELAVAMRAA